MLRIKFAGKTDRGKKRSHNEDFFYAEFPLFIVADGLGGHLAGEVASETAVMEVVKEVKQKYFEAKSVSELKKILKESILKAGEAVFLKSRQKKEFRGMGTTISAAALLNNQIVIAHVGDSRIYLFRDDKLKQLTKDHTYIQFLIDKGEITEEEAKDHPLKNALLQALGSERKVEVEVKSLKFKVQDKILLCTDGLYNMITEEEIKNVIKEDTETKEKVERLIKKALNAGGLDNVTAILLEVVENEN